MTTDAQRIAAEARQEALAGVTLAPGVVRAASWWLAAELAARYPALRVYETHPAGGTYDCLSVRGPEPVIFDLNRNGRVHLHNAAGSAMPMLTWLDVVTAPEPARIVTELGDAAGLQPSTQPTAIQPHVLVYQCAAHILALTTFDGRDFDVRSEYFDSSGYGQGPRGYIAHFDHPRLREGRRDTDLLGIPGYRYWAVLTNGEPVALMDTDGYAYFDRRAVYLPDRFAQGWHSTAALVGSVFGTTLR